MYDVNQTARSDLLSSTVFTYQNKRNRECPTLNRSLSISLIPTLKVENVGTLALTVGGSKDFKGEEQYLLSDGVLSFGLTPQRLNPFFTAQEGLSVILPISIASREQNSLILGARLAPKLTCDLSATRVAALQGLSFFGQAVGGHNLHSYETSTTGKANTQTLLGVVAGGEYARGIFGMSLSFSRTQYWKYQKGQSDRYGVSGEVAANLGDATSLALGYLNSGNGLKANGQESNVSVFSSEDSSIYLGLTGSI